MIVGPASCRSAKRASVPLDPRFSLLNRALRTLGLLAVDWLGDPRASVPAITLFVVGKIFGYNMLVFRAALGTVSDKLSEAARLDGEACGCGFATSCCPRWGRVCCSPRCSAW